MTQKTLLALGGSRLLMPIIDAAHALGHRVVTCDYLPDNYAHQFADEYLNVSIIDREAVVQAAHDVQADGIVSFAADPGVISAAYAAEALGLPQQVSAETAVTLQTKHLFREFLARTGLPSPRSWLVNHIDQVRDVVQDISYPVIVKPADAAGSKGVTRVDDPRSLQSAVARALSFSVTSNCIIESFIATDEPQRSAEGFALDGTFVAVHFMDQIFDVDGPNPYAPAGNIIPSTMSEKALSRVTEDLQQIARTLDFGSGLFNIEVRVAADGTPYIIEISPRGGGNRLAEFIRHATGQDLIRATVQAAVGDPIYALPTPRLSGHWVQEVLQSPRTGTYTGIHVNENFSASHLREMSLWVEPGDEVSSFDHASYALGTAISAFNDRAAVDEHLSARDIVISVAPRTGEEAH